MKRVSLQRVCLTALGLLVVAVLREQCPRCPTLRSSRTAQSQAPALTHSPSSAARMEARQWYRRATQAASDDLQALEDWDAAGLKGSEWQEFQKQLAGHARELNLALQAGRRALALATTAHERRQAVLLLTRVECGLGRHDRELEYEQLAASLALPDSQPAFAPSPSARCPRMAELAQKADKHKE